MADKKNKKDITPSSFFKVSQANELVSARYTLTLIEQRLVLTMISRIQPSDEDFKEYRISIPELANFIGVDRNSAYRECKKVTENLLKRVITIEEPERLLQTHWVSSADYKDGEGCVVLCFDPKLKPYLLNLQGSFTSSGYEMLMGFKSQYTIRIYNLLKQHEKLKIRVIEVDSLRDMLGLTSEQHKEYSNFKANILKPIQKEFEAKADITFEFDEIKYGRRVGALRFHISKNKKIKPLLPELPELPEVSIESLPYLAKEVTDTLGTLLALIPEQHRTKKTILTALKAYESKEGFDYVRRNIMYCNEKSEKSYAGFLNNALKGDWGHDWDLEQKDENNKKPKPKPVWESMGYKSEKEYAEASFNKQMAELDRFRKTA